MTETEATEATEDTEATAAGPDAQRPTPEPRGPWTSGPWKSGPWKSGKRYAGIGLVAVVFAGAFGAAGLLGWKLWDQHALSRAGQAARQTAITYAQVLTSIDSNKVDQNFAEVLDGATGEFKDMYTRSSVQLRQLLIDNKATAHGVVVASAIQSESKDKVVVLLMIDQTVTNTARPDPRVDRSRMKMTMEKLDGRWLASKVELP